MSELQLAEKEGLNKLVYIPFHDQQSSLPKLIRQYGDMFIEMQKECFKKLDPITSLLRLPKSYLPL